MNAIPVLHMYVTLTTVFQSINLLYSDFIKYGKSTLSLNNFSKKVVYQYRVAHVIALDARDPLKI